MKMNRITLTFLLAACCLVGAASEITGILKLTPKQANQNGEIIEIEVQPEKKSAGRTGLSIELGNVPGGRRLVCRAEFRGEKITQTPKGESGLRLQFAATTPGGPVYQNTRLAPYGDFDWTPVEVSTVVPFDATAVCLNAGLQGVSGKLFVRNIKITSEDLILDLRSAVNMGYADPVAGDGKGGWSDQGPTNDASRFRFRHVSLYAGMPFQPLDPAKNDGKAVVTMHSLRFAGPKKIPLVTGGKLPGGRYLYLLHGLTWGGDTKGKVDTNYIGKPVGALTVHSVNGREHRFEIVNGRDVADWWELRPLPNATVGVTWRNGAVLVGLYATRFELPKDFGPVESVAVESASSGSIWLIVGLT